MQHPIYDVDGNILHVADIYDDIAHVHKNHEAIRWAVKTGTSLARANLEWFDLTALDLRSMDFTGANIKNAFFTRSNLRGSTFSHDVPVVEKIHQTVFKAASKEWSLWSDLVVMLAGEKGLKLENEIGTEPTAALIYMASDPGLESIPRFYESKIYVLTDMKWLAVREKK